MILLIIICILLLINLRKPKSPGLLLLVIYLISLIGGILLGFDFEVKNGFDFFNLIYQIIILSLFILPWLNVNYSLKITQVNEYRVKKLAYAIILINVISFVIFAIATYYAFTTVTEYSSFKNDGSNDYFYKSLPINGTLYLLALYLNATSIFLIPLHLYFLSHRKLFLSMLSLVLSFNVILEGLSNFSRSSFVLYIIVYIFCLPFFYPKFDVSTKRKIKIIGSFFSILILVFFILISINRFTDYFMYGDAQYNNTVIKNPIVYSMIDYLSQWYMNSGIVMSKYNFETFNGELSSPFIITLANKFGLIDYNPNTIIDKLIAAWGSKYDKFNGLVPNLLFDFGYICTLLFSIMYFIAIKILTKRKNTVELSKLFLLVTMFILPSMGIFNSQLKSTNYNLLILYSIFIYIYLNHKKIKHENIGI